ncbi:hypothetical protein BDP81DRAFT_434027 [Colletotrichum phormii]|uniref:Secreted protein n=1 Tax=Colletotrichum phormii TaxID=359342 RepID=A0AAJ0EDY6_9PEZI|nr:uncharacterized protein BDP81DRAFT_434027 [Colletotrichum phormii]KAK1633566.1 hypothetical protein BDP81DRAFT_434027 [Colletotrichum phormii]
MAWLWSSSALARWPVLSLHLWLVTIAGPASGCVCPVKHPHFAQITLLTAFSRQNTGRGALAKYSVQVEAGIGKARSKEEDGTKLVPRRLPLSGPKRKRKGKEETDPARHLLNLASAIPYYGPRSTSYAVITQARPTV